MGEETKFVRPSSPDLQVRDSRSLNVIPATGMNVPWIGPEGRYWRRRVMDGSCIIVDEPVAEVSKEPEAPKIEKYDTSSKKTRGEKEE